MSMLTTARPARRDPVSRQGAPKQPQKQQHQPKLEVVGAPARTWRRLRRVVVIAGILAALAMPFALVVVHLELSAGEVRLSNLQTQGDAAQEQFEKLRLQVSQLEAPDRIVATAGQLGMVTPTTITYLSAPAGATSAPAAATTTPTTTAALGINGWTSAKKVDVGR